MPMLSPHVEYEIGKQETTETRKWILYSAALDKNTVFAVEDLRLVLIMQFYLR